MLHGSFFTFDIKMISYWVMRYFPDSDVTYWWNRSCSTWSFHVGNLNFSFGSQQNCRPGGGWKTFWRRCSGGRGNSRYGPCFLAHTLSCHNTHHTGNVHGMLCIFQQIKAKFLASLFEFSECLRDNFN